MTKKNNVDVKYILNKEKALCRNRMGDKCVNLNIGTNSLRL